MATGEQLQEMAKTIMNYEARRDSKGHLAIYDLPSGDGGGRYEVAGINERYNPQELSALVKMLRQGQYQQAENYALAYYLSDTNVVTSWQNGLDPGVEFYLRDCVFNRGAHGAAVILQMALGVAPDGTVGPITRGALKTADPDELLTKLRAARERYERIYAHRDESSKFWRGLVNRWNNALADAKRIRGMTNGMAGGKITS